MFTEKLIKLLNLASSTNDNEALSAFRKAEELVKKNGLRWDSIIITDAPPAPITPQDGYPDIQDMIMAIRESVGEEFDFTFLDSVDKQHKRLGRLSNNQLRALRNIYDICVDN